MHSSDNNPYDLAVIGTGMAGTAAAVFAANRGLATAQVGQAGEIIFASGYLDLLGVYPQAEKNILKDPWAGMERLAGDHPEHPLARVAPEKIRLALDEFLAFLEAGGVPFCRGGEENSTVLTPLGTTKPTYCVPQTMWAGTAALREKKHCLLVDIRGLRGFSARQIAAVWSQNWPRLRTVTVHFPDSEHLSELYAETMARQLELPRYLDRLAERIKPHVKNARVVGLPAILGCKKHTDVFANLEEILGVSIFEIPTMPPGISGLRLREVFGARIPQLGVRLFREQRVLAVYPEKSGFFTLTIDSAAGEETIRAARIIFAGGRFLGKGLLAAADGIREPLFDLPVYQPRSRSRWHRRYFLDPRGHRINRAGLETDKAFRPLDGKGRPVFENLFAVGSILAHQDWMRQKCGSGLAIATAYAAVEAIAGGQ